MIEKYYIEEINSTNNLMREMVRKEKLPEFQVVYTGFQTTGKGQTGNSWESERDKNLLFSILFYPTHISIEEHFILSQLVAFSVVEVLNEITSGFQVKWPNDIYFGDKKAGGILIENTLQGSKISSTVAGIGINVNQAVFRSDAPNPVSLFQITGKELNREELLEKICERIELNYKFSTFDHLREKYISYLYRGKGFYPYKSENETFNASIKNISPDGKLTLQTETGEIKEFYFKEVEFVRRNFFN